MLNKIISIMLLIWWLLAAHVMAQSTISDQPSLSKITPPAPNAAALGKFGDIPVNMATGIPRINVPLYSYENEGNSLQLDVTLDYHAGGVRVNDVASDAGIGWVLNAGGAVIRTRRGIPDEIAGFGFMNDTSILDEYQGNKCYNGYQVNFYSEVAVNHYDGQNDIFTFNFAGRAGKFMYGKHGDFLMLTSNKIKVENKIDSGEIKSFLITDEKGTRYVFDAIEHSDDGIPSNYHIHASAWYLSKIIAPFSTDSITLEYESENSRYTTGKFVTSLYSEGGSPPSKPTPETSYSTVITTGKRLKKINFPNGVAISFLYDTALRTDQESASSMYRLKQIAISDGTYTRGYNLYHDYSTNRLTLKKVFPYNASGEMPGYEFTYNIALPVVLSNEQDHWGFYNTNTANDMIPKYFIKGKNVTLPGGNRSTDPNRVKAGSLARMKYPAGGYTDFEMEANTSEDPRLTDSTYTVINQKSSSYGFYVTATSADTMSFVYNGDAGATLSATATIFQNGSCKSGSSTCNFIIQLKNSANAVIFTKTIASDASMQYKDYAFTISNMQAGRYLWNVSVQNMNYDNYLTVAWTELHNNHPDTTKTIVKDLYIGGLRVKSIKDYDGNHTWPANARTYEYVQKGTSKSSGALGIIPEYEYPVYYQFYAGIDKNGGEHLPEDNYYIGYGLTNCIVRVSSPTQSLATVNGSAVSYSRVVENYANNNQSNGSRECYFSSYPVGGLGGYNPFPYTPPQYADYSYGQLQREVIYNAKGDSVRTTVNQYQTYRDTYYSNTARLTNFTSIALSPVVFEFAELATSPAFTAWSQVRQPIYYASRAFTPGAGRMDLVKRTVTDYVNGLGIAVETSYVLDTAFNIKTITTYNSKGERIDTVKYFPYEYTTSIASTMKARNMYAAEISKETWKTTGSNKYLVNGLVNQYTTFGTMIKMGGIAVARLSAPMLSANVGTFNPASFNRNTGIFKDDIIYSQYSSKGVITQQSRVNNVQQSYIYGYNGYDVIAEVINAAVTEIAYTGFEESGKGGWTYAGTPASDATAMSGGKIYTLSAGALTKNGLSTGKSYKITYWSRNGAATISGTTNIKGETRNGWTYYEHTVPAGVTAVTVQGSVTIDDIRLYPADASMTTYTWQPLYGITSVCDQKNTFTYYQYDGFGRLKTIKDLNGNVLKMYDYQYLASLTK